MRGGEAFTILSTALGWDKAAMSSSKKFVKAPECWE